uniref:Protein kinase domain-containing protein n=1 Tax=Kalanchoe fedtschenkoi TaxID=63787 RepID=A0A7N0UFC3_KALFE
MRHLLCVVALLAVSAVVLGSVNPSLNADVLGLIVFKADVQDPAGKLVNWNEDDDSPCGWTGVTCNRRFNRVSELVLDGFSLSGHIGRGLLQLEYLRKLSLANNNLTGTVSPGLVRLSNLRTIDLSGNSLSGTLAEDFFQQCGPLRSISLARNSFLGQIPDSLTSCSTLAAIDLSSNRFTGSLPTGIWNLSGIRSLDLSHNMLVGEIPESIEAWNNLRSVSLKNNQFSGVLPNGIGSLLLIRAIDLSENSFSGMIPDTLQKLTLCGYLDLHGNKISGELPSWIGQLKNLETLDLSSNSFSGEVPSSLGDLHALKVLNLSANGFAGTLPESLINSSELLVLDLSENSLVGNLPPWIFKLDGEKVLVSNNKLDAIVESHLSSSTNNSSQKLQVLDLSKNAFSGGIDPAVGDSTSLQLLNLSGNSLTGAIPSSIGKLKALAKLDLSANHLNGGIPTEIGEVISLQELRLQANLLSGSIPSSLGSCSSLETMILSHNNLQGPIPVSVAKLINLQRVDFSFNNLSGSLPKQLGNLPNLLSFNISHNNLQGELPTGAFFNTIPPSSVSGNQYLCGSAVKKDCPSVLPKPIVLNPNSSGDPVSGSSSSTLGHKKTILSISALVAIGAAAVIVVGVIAITVLNLQVRSSASRSAAAIVLSGGDEFSNSPSVDGNSGKLVMFSGDPDFSTGTHALLNKDCELGRGGFGAVYRTLLRDGRPVAIKKLTVSSLVKSQDDFEKEVKKLGKIRHPNLVSLEGYYWTPSLQLLISEFVSGGSLYKHLHEGSANVLSWTERFNIILGTARSLAHLHKLNIIHYNMKSSNVLIDSSGDPKVGDFGIARLLPMLDRYVLSSKIQSALGYMAPEFACRTVKITEKCDVYGFGVLVLEIVTGKRPVEYMEDDVVVLCDMVRGALEDGKVEECVDARLHGKFPGEEAIPVIKLGLICTSQVPSSRPDMAEVVNILELIKSPSEGQEELV